MELISIVVPAYKAANVISATLDSILAQTYQPIEVIVVDDGSPDNTAEVVAPYVAKHGEFLRLVRKPNGGVASARNAGFAQSKGAFVLFLDQDDIITPSHVQRLHAALKANADWGVAYSAARYIDESGEKNLGDIVLPKSGHLLPELVLRRVALPSTGVGLIRRSVVEIVGGYDEQRNTVADIDYWIRVARAGYAIGYVPDVSFWYRISPDSMSSQARKQETEDLSLLEKIYDIQPVPAELLAIKDEAYAVAYYENAARYFRTGEASEGRDRLRKAIAASPKLAADEAWLRDWVSFNAMSPRTQNVTKFVETLFANLPSEAQTLRRMQKRLLANLHVAMTFDAYRSQRYREVLPHALAGLRGNWGVLQNRGFVSIFLRSMLRSLPKLNVQVWS